MKPNYWLLVVGVLLIVLDDCLSMLGLRKLANLLYGNVLERIKKHEPMRTRFLWLYLMHERILVIPC